MTQQTDDEDWTRVDSDWTRADSNLVSVFDESHFDLAEGDFGLDRADSNLVVVRITEVELCES